MLLGNFFNIHERTASGNDLIIAMALNPSHPIFEGHFPEQPVVPGVCMLQIIKELLELETNKRLQLKKADHLKFLAVINPLDSLDFSASFVYEDRGIEGIFVSGKLFREAVVFLKFKGSFVEVV